MVNRFTDDDDLPDFNPLSLLGQVFDSYEKNLEKQAEDSYKDEVLGNLADIQRKLDHLYSHFGALAAVILSDLNKLPLNITRGEIGGFLGRTRDSWRLWHQHQGEAKNLFWNGHELFNQLVADARNGTPPLQYAVVADLSTLMIALAQLAKHMGKMLDKQDRHAAFRSYLSYFKEAINGGAGSLADRGTAMRHLQEVVLENLKPVQEESSIKLHSVGRGQFSPQVYEDCYREKKDPQTVGQWRVRVYAFGGTPDYTPPINRLITIPMLIQYIADPNTIPRILSVLEQHNHDWPDQQALIAHAVAHQDAISIPTALYQVVEARYADLERTLTLANQAGRFAEARAG